MFNFNFNIKNVIFFQCEIQSKIFVINLIFNVKNLPLIFSQCEILFINFIFNAKNFLFNFNLNGKFLSFISFSTSKICLYFFSQLYSLISFSLLKFFYNLILNSNKILFNFIFNVKFLFFISFSTSNLPLFFFSIY